MQQAEHNKKHQNSHNFILGENREFSNKNYIALALFDRSVHFRRHYADCFKSTTSTAKLPPHLFCLVHRVRKPANINGKKLFSLKPVVRTRRSYRRGKRGARPTNIYASVSSFYFLLTNRFFRVIRTGSPSHASAVHTASF
jgi:hypothetical protein